MVISLFYFVFMYSNGSKVGLYMFIIAMGYP